MNKKMNHVNAKSVTSISGGTRSWVWGRDLDKAVVDATDAGWVVQFRENGAQKTNWERKDRVRFNENTGSVEIWDGENWNVWTPESEHCARIKPPYTAKWFVYDFIGKRWAESAGNGEQWEAKKSTRWAGSGSRRNEWRDGWGGNG